MNHIPPHRADTPGEGATILPFPAHCREYLGREWGWCPSRANQGETLCAYHLAERDAFWHRQEVR